MMPHVPHLKKQPGKISFITTLLSVSIFLSFALGYFIWLIPFVSQLPVMFLQVGGFAIVLIGIGITTLDFYFFSFYLNGDNRRQQLFPPEFRICKIPLPKNVSLSSNNNIEDLCLAYEALQEGSSTHSKSNADIREGDQLLFSICTEFWRLKRRITSEMNQGELESSQVPKYVDRIDRALQSANITIHDHTGEKYFPGMAVKPISLQPSDNIAPGEERIIETVRPSICRDGLVIKQGEVVIATSITNQENNKIGENQT